VNITSGNLVIISVEKPRISSAAIVRACAYLIRHSWITCYCLGAYVLLGNWANACWRGWIGNARLPEPLKDSGWESICSSVSESIVCILSKGVSFSLQFMIPGMQNSKTNIFLFSVCYACMYVPINPSLYFGSRFLFIYTTTNVGSRIFLMTGKPGDQTIVSAKDWLSVVTRRLSRTVANWSTLTRRLLGRHIVIRRSPQCPKPVLERLRHLLWILRWQMTWAQSDFTIVLISSLP